MIQGPCLAPLAQGGAVLFSWVMGATVSGPPDAEHSVKLPEKARPGLKKLIQKAFTAQSHKVGLQRAQAVVAMYEQEYPEAMKCLATDLEEVLSTLRFPESHRKRIRTTNLLERLFGEGFWGCQSHYGSAFDR